MSDKDRDDQRAEIAVLQRDMTEVKKTLETLCDKVDGIRSPKLGPTILVVVAVCGFIITAGGAWVNLRLEPIRSDILRDQKDIERLKDDGRLYNSRIDSKADKAYVDDKIAYAYDRLKTEIKLKQQTP